MRVSSGTLYGRKAGEGYIRVNLACPRHVLRKGLKRIARLQMVSGEPTAIFSL